MNKFIISSLASAVIATTQPVMAQEVKFLVGFAPGGGQYLITNILSEALTKQGVKNQMLMREGAGGVVGMNECVQQNSKDMLCMTSQAQIVHSMVLNDNVRKYNPEELTYVKAIGVSPTVLVTNINNTKSVKEIIEDIKTKKVNFGTGALGLTVLTKHMLKQLDAKDAETVEYKGTGPVLVDIQGKHIDYAPMPYAVAKTAFENKQVRIVATFQETDEMNKLGIPKIQSSIQGLDEDYTIFGFVMAPNIEASIVKKHEQMLGQLMVDPTVKDKLLGQGIFPMPVRLQKLSFSEIATLERNRLSKYLGVMKN